MNLREAKTAKYFLSNTETLVHTVSKPSHRGNGHDIFHLWDHLIISSNTLQIGTDLIPAGETIYVQTKSRKQYGKDLEKYRSFPAKWKYIFVWEKGDNGRYSLTVQSF